MIVAVAVVAVAVGVVAVAWPYLPSLLPPAGLTAAKRSAWVARLFQLAAESEECGEAAVAEAARSLISAIVSPPPAARKGK